ncbi:glycosyltransferase family 2 protein [Actinophytocola sp.]|uniref:glycosyltransferase family 2 protein n=1 Tax=Actinophytocola sp. TaxID=1872138 RepID=UPI002EDB26CC
MGSLHSLNEDPSSNAATAADAQQAGTPLLSIVVPAKDEAENLPVLAARIRQAIAGAVDYELVIVDDHSTDETAEVAAGLGADHPIVLVVRRGVVPGKGYALLDGFARSSGAIVCMIDADLQYPPEAIPAMVSLVRSRACDVVVANRSEHHTNALRRAFSRLSYRLIQALHKLDVDVQSGLKVFRRQVLDTMTVRPSGWALDLDMLVSAHAAGYSILGHDIAFARREHGETKVRLFGTSWQIMRNAVALKLAGARRTAARAAGSVAAIEPAGVDPEPSAGRAA